MSILHFGDVRRRLGVTGGRRPLLTGLAGAILAVIPTRSTTVSGAVEERTRRGGSPRQSRLNAYGCLNVGQPCTNARHCCSGICNGKKGKRRCRAHGTGACPQRAPGLCTAANPALALPHHSPRCACLETTGGSAFHGALASARTQCADCRKDADCVAQGFPAGSACVPFATGACAGSCPGGMICAAPCSTEPVERT